MTPSTVVAVAAEGLTGSMLTFPDEPLPNAQWLTFLAAVKSERVPGLLSWAIDAGHLPATEMQQADAADALQESMGLAVTLERTLVQSVQALENVGIPSRVLKGPAVAHLVYPDPALRSFHDVDLLVRPADFDKAVDVLGDAGCRRLQRRLSPGFDAQFGKAATLKTAGGSEVDVHRTFVGGRFGLSIDLDGLFERHSVFELAGRTFAALAPEERFLHACYHAAIGDPMPRLVSLRDVAEMLLHVPLDLDRVERLARTWRAQPVVARAVRETWQTFGLVDLTALSVWAQRYEPTRSEKRAVRAYTTRRSGGGQALTSLGAIPGLSAKLSFIRSVALPDRDYLKSTTSPRRAAWLKRGIRSALRLHRGGPA